MIQNGEPEHTFWLGGIPIRKAKTRWEREPRAWETGGRWGQSGGRNEGPRERRNWGGNGVKEMSTWGGERCSGHGARCSSLATWVEVAPQ